MHYLEFAEKSKKVYYKKLNKLSDEKSVYTFLSTRKSPDMTKNLKKLLRNSETSNWSISKKLSYRKD